MKMRCSLVSRQYHVDSCEPFPFPEADSFNEGSEGGGTATPLVEAPQFPQNFWPDAIAEPH